MKVRAEQVAASRATDVDGFDVPAPAGLSYLPYQRAGIAYALARTGVLIADEMGLGKTVQAIGVINALSPGVRVLIVAPRSLVLNWFRELQRWHVGPFNMAVHPHQPVAFPGVTSVTICSFGEVKHYVEEAQSGGVWDLLVVDEAHQAKNPAAQRTKALRAVARRSKRRVALTGTPILNRPVELFTLLQWIAPHEWDPAGWKVEKNANGDKVRRKVAAGEGAGFMRYAFRYCDAHQERVSRTKMAWVFDGASHLDELQERLRASVMVRRLKADVLPELPPKRRRIVVLDAAPCREEREWSPARVLDAIAVQGPAFTELTRVRHETARKKAPAVVEYLTEVLESTPKAIVFAHHHDVAQVIAEGIAQALESGAVVVGPMTGATPAAERQAMVERFQSDPHARVIVGTIGAMGTGHTLTAASYVAFAESSYVPAELTQAEDRAHRLTQRASVLVDHLVSAGSIDERMLAIVMQKQTTIDQALDVKP